ncbi:hypothetical protein ACIQW5_25505 [Methylorubrum thiocyanatum]|jgi:hypothetical protein|uniref:Uncharacterized protein n=1 Tax=Methylobacterium persicinum TaxID=374426 RepID=A0ABU0HRA8_9HYPH|nr:hypothetical protein [Methylobacterium persicinum]GJE36038.1 hypothetical protein KHHGKMAE_0084 [Methylobacterium persicinum]
MREGPDPKRRRRSPVTAAIIAAVSTLIVNFAVDRFGLISETSYVPGLIIRSGLVALLMWMSFRTLEAMRR